MALHTDKLIHGMETTHPICFQPCLISNMKLITKVPVLIIYMDVGMGKAGVIRIYLPYKTKPLLHRLERGQSIFLYKKKIFSQKNQKKDEMKMDTDSLKNSILEFSLLAKCSALKILRK